MERKSGNRKSIGRKCDVMVEIPIKITDDKIEVGSSPKLMIDLKNQHHMINYQEKKIPYRVNIRLSPDLLRGQRRNVFQSAMMYYYRQACQYAEDLEIAQAYRKKKEDMFR